MCDAHLTKHTPKQFNINIKRLQVIIHNTGVMWCYCLLSTEYGDPEFVSGASCTV